MMQSKFTTFFVLTRLFLLSAPVLIILIVLVTYLTDPVYYKSELSPVIEILAASLVFMCAYLLFTEKSLFRVLLSEDGIHIVNVMRQKTKFYSYNDVVNIQYENISAQPLNKYREADYSRYEEREKTYTIHFCNGDKVYLSLENYDNAEELCKFINQKRLL